MATPGEVTVRREAPGDEAAIGSVVDEAFAPDETVAALVEAIRASERFVPSLSLVAAHRGGIVGHVLLSHADVVDSLGAPREVLTLAPLAVAVPWQRRGVGTLLVRSALAQAEALGERVVVVEGHPSYYPRFGFLPAASLGIDITLPGWASPEAAMALALAAYAGGPKGRVVYPPAFDDVVER